MNREKTISQEAANDGRTVNLEHVKKQYYRFQLRSTIADAGYDSWKQRVFGKRI